MPLCYLCAAYLFETIYHSLGSLKGIYHTSGYWDDVHQSVNTHSAALLFSFLYREHGSTPNWHGQRACIGLRLPT